MDKLANEIVERPNHYIRGGLECFHTFRQVQGDDKAVAFALGNVWKYIWRATGDDAKHQELAGQIEDLEKAAKYIRLAVEVLKNENP